MAEASADALTKLIEVSRTLGSDRSLVLHGGGNSSAKVSAESPTGHSVDALYVKSSGSDMRDADRTSFVLLDLATLRTALPYSGLGPEQFRLMQQRARLDSGAASPSVEALVHAALPHKFVLHSHADAIVTLTNTPDGAALVKQVLGERFVVCEYAMPGPALGSAIWSLWNSLPHQAQQDVLGIVVLNHGLFTFCDDAQQSLENHLHAVAVAQSYIEQQLGQPLEPIALRSPEPSKAEAVELAQLRRELSERAGHPVVLTSRRAEGKDLGDLPSGPITPDHVNYVGYRPLDLEREQLSQWGKEYLPQSGEPQNAPLPILSRLPRVIVGKSTLSCVGRTRKESLRSVDIVEHQLASAHASSALGGYQPASTEHVRDLEFWLPQMNKLRATDNALPLAGRIALVTGAASGIGKACAAELLASGATVVGWDISEGVSHTFDSPEWIGMRVDVTDAEAQAAAVHSIVAQCGGLDILVVAAGIFPTAQHLTELDPNMWQRTMSINVDSVVTTFGLVQPFLALSPSLGRVCVVASKNFAAPGPGAAAYSSSKAALTQLSRVAALEWAQYGIRVNMVHPDAVFDTALWTPELLAKRADHYGMTVDEYKTRNLLRTEVRSADVGRLVRAMADDTFIATTGAQVPIDGGNERVI